VAAALVVVGTPIGNDEDWTPRALRELAEADVVAAEDTRVARGRLARVGVTAKRFLSLHDHNERQRLAQVLGLVRAGQRVALVSDAGMPLVSDPGYRVVRAAVEEGLEVDVVPGPTAMTSALVLSGLPSDRFAFVGFPPRSSGRRLRWLTERSADTATWIMYESPHRLVATLGDLDKAVGARACAVVFSITKPWQRVRRGTPSELLVHFEADPEDVKGELTLLVAGAPEVEATLDRRATTLIDALVDGGVSASTVRDAVAAALDLPRRAVYQYALTSAERADQRTDDE